MGSKRTPRPRSISAPAATEPPISKRRRTRPIIETAILFVLISLIVIPTVPRPKGTGLDDSWVFALNMGHFDRMVFGQDIIFTYGPLGYLALATFPEAEPWVVFAFLWGIALVSAYALWRLCRNAGHWTTICLYLGVFLCYRAFSFDATVEQMMVAILALTLLIASRLGAGPWLDLGLLLFFAGVALLTKFNVGIIASLIGLYFWAFLLWRHRSRVRQVWKPATVVAIVWPVTFVGLYWITDGTPWGLAAFLRNSADIARGFSDAMALPGPFWPAVALSAAWLVLLIGFLLLARESRRLRWGIPPLIIISFLCYKSAMVRQDAHPLPFAFQIAVAALLVVALAPNPRNRILAGTFAIASTALGITLIAQLWPDSLPPDLDRLSVRAVLRNLDGFVHWKTTVKTLEAATRQALISDQLPSEFRPYVTGRGVAAYPYEIAMIRASSLRWQPLPVIQAYSAYTPALDLLNAQELEDASGPEQILLSWASIDGRHPFYETPLSWRALLSWYDLELRSPTLDLLRRRSTPRFGAAVRFGEPVVAQWNERITLPVVGDDEALVMEAEMGQSLKGVLKNALLRGPVITVQVRARSGHTDFRRVVRANLTNGVIVSDWPYGLNDLAPILSGGGSFLRDRVASILFSSAAPSELDPEIHIRWSRIKLLQPAVRRQP